MRVRDECIGRTIQAKVLLQRRWLIERKQKKQGWGGNGH